jgi:hypothetical protein
MSGASLNELHRKVLADLSRKIVVALIVTRGRWTFFEPPGLHKSSDSRLRAATGSHVVRGDE